MLSLRVQAHHPIVCPATVALDVDEIGFVGAVERMRARDVPPNPMVQEVMLPIAEMCGFLTSNAVPIWRVIERGVGESLLMYDVYLMASWGDDV